MEVWNGQRSTVHNALALEHWYGPLASGRWVVATAGTDNHGSTYRPDHGLTCTPATTIPSGWLRNSPPEKPTSPPTPP